MQITLLKAKLHRACVTHVELDYEGSCAIDGDLLDLAGIHEYEQIQIYNLANGERFTTYAIRAEHGSRIISINGAAAHKASVGDRIIICAYAGLDAAELAGFKPVLVYCDGHNRVTGTANAIPMQMAS
ncbi:MAG: aspartate 1-decarboxylase [Pseudomonadota bacterium]|nr:aspartate 1-decarboxylase [Pseudomonadota bacterium]